MGDGEGLLVMAGVAAPGKTFARIGVDFAAGVCSALARRAGRLLIVLVTTSVAVSALVIVLVTTLDSVLVIVTTSRIDTRTLLT